MSADATPRLRDLPDVDPAGATGTVVTKQADGTFAMEAGGGGGGGLPAWWTVVSTPGSEVVQFNGRVGVVSNQGGGVALSIEAGPAQAEDIVQIGDSSFDVELLTVGPTGAVTISPSDATVTGLSVQTGAPDTDDTIVFQAFGAGSGVAWWSPFSGFNVEAGATADIAFKVRASAADRLAVTADGEIGFYGATPVAQPADVDTLADLWAALKDLGLLDAGSDAPSAGGVTATDYIFLVNNVCKR